MKMSYWAMFFGGLLIAGLLVGGEALASELQDTTPFLPVRQPPIRDVMPVECPKVMPCCPVEMRVGLDILVDGRPLPIIHHACKDYLPVPRRGEEYESASGIMARAGWWPWSRSMDFRSSPVSGPRRPVQAMSWPRTAPS